MDKKILKYKNKKNKLENEIQRLLKIKKEKHENEIIISNNNIVIIEFVEKFLNELKLNNEQCIKKLIIIVSGNYSVGKSTFISNLENYILKISENILNFQKTNIIENISFENILFENISFEDKISEIHNNKIIIIEVTNNKLINLINQINFELDPNISLLNIKIIPKDENSLKNKFINKIIFDIKNNTCNFIQNLNINNDIINKNIKTNIDLLKLKKFVYSDDDFIFLNQVVDLIYNLKYDEITDYKFKKIDITTFFL